jgi:hypothetical protein
MRISALCTAIVTYVVVGHPPPAVAHLERAYAALMQWFEQHLGSAAK